MKVVSQSVRNTDISRKCLETVVTGGASSGLGKACSSGVWPVSLLKRCISPKTVYFSKNQYISLISSKLTKRLFTADLPMLFTGFCGFASLKGGVHLEVATTSRWTSNSYHSIVKPSSPTGRLWWVSGRGVSRSSVPKRRE